MKTNVLTADLTGAALDWAVAKCADLPFPVVYDEDGREVAVSPSTNWAQGGPIIERECIATHRDMRYAEILWVGRMPFNDAHSGSTPLIAAMRCFVASRLSDEIEIPEELIDNNKEQNK